MKKVIFLLALTLNLSVFAQKDISEGVFTSKQIMISSNEQMNSQLAMLGDMMTTTYFKGNKSRSEMSNPMVGSSVTIMDYDSNEMIIALDNPMMGKKYMAKSAEPSEEDLKNITIIKGEETKTFLGYVCNQYNIVIMKDGVEVQMTIYATDELSIVSKQSSTLGSEFKGFPMFTETNVSQSGMDMKITHEVISIESEEVSDDKFDMTPPEGYEKTDNLQGM